MQEVKTHQVWMPSLKNKTKKEKKKAMLPIWSDSDEFFMEEECENEVANMCLITLENHGDKVNYNSSYDELHETFEELYLDLEKLGTKNVLPKRKIVSLESELLELKENFDLCEKAKSFAWKENDVFEKKNEWLTSSWAFDFILAIQKCIFDKNELGYKPSNFIWWKASIESSSTIYNFCGKGDYISSTCPLQLKYSHVVKAIWFQMREKTNPQELKKV